MLVERGAHTPIMHLIGIVATIGTGIYTLAWAWGLLKGGDRVGALWSMLLAVAPQRPVCGSTTSAASFREQKEARGMTPGCFIVAVAVASRGVICGNKTTSQ